MSPKRKQLFITISAVAVVAIVIVASFYALQPKEPQITVKEGSNSYTFIGDFINETNTANVPSFLNYSATSTFTETGGKNYSLNASMHGSAYGSGLGPPSFVFDLFFYLAGILPYNLHPSGLEISIEPVPGSTPAFTSYLKNTVFQNDYFVFSTPKPVNVSVSGKAPGFPGSLNLNLTLLNDSGLRPNQTFYFSLTDTIESASAAPFVSLQYNTSYGLSVTASLEGLSNPVSVTLYLFFIDIPKG